MSELTGYIHEIEIPCAICDKATLEGIPCVVDVDLITGAKLIFNCYLCPTCFLQEYCEQEPAMVTIEETGGG